jgi:hypothetical protein
MSRRQRKKETAKQAARAPDPRPTSAAPPPRRTREEFLLGPGGFADRIVGLGFGRDAVLRTLAVAAVRLCGEGPTARHDAGEFFACLGEAMGTSGRFGGDLRLYERCEAALRSTFYMAQFGEQTKDRRLTADDRRILRQWTN